jgi:hypothetical protein
MRKAFLCWFQTEWGTYKKHKKCVNARNSNGPTPFGQAQTIGCLSNMLRCRPMGCIYEKFKFFLVNANELNQNSKSNKEENSEAQAELFEHYSNSYFYLIRWKIQ